MTQTRNIQNPDLPQEKVTHTYWYERRPLRMRKTISLPCKAHLYILIQRRAKLAPPTRSGGPLLMLPVVRETFDKTLNRVCVEFLNIYLRVCTCKFLLRKMCVCAFWWFRSELCGLFSRGACRWLLSTFRVVGCAHGLEYKFICEHIRN